MRDSFNKSYEQNLKDEAKLQEDMVGRKDNIEGVMAFVEKENQNSQANNYIIENFSEHHLDDVMELNSCQPHPWSKHILKKFLNKGL